jgi:hypothetical protein
MKHPAFLPTKSSIEVAGSKQARPRFSFKPQFLYMSEGDRHEKRFVFKFATGRVV